MTDTHEQAIEVDVLDALDRLCANLWRYSYEYTEEPQEAAANEAFRVLIKYGRRPEGYLD